MYLRLLGVGLALPLIGSQPCAELLELHLIGRALQHCMAQVLE
jgi:hypothetical protein